MKITILILLISINLIAAEDKKKFYPSITNAATTNGPWGFSYETFPGASGLSSWPFNSLSVGIGNRFQVGTTPVLYLVKEHQSNINLKWNFYQGEQLYVAFGVTSVKWKLPGGIEVIESDGSTSLIDSFELNTGGFSFNYFFKNSIFAIGFNLNYVDIKTSSQALNDQIKGNDNELPMEWLFDLSIALNPLVITLGCGETRSDAFDFSDNPKPFGFGGSLTYLRGTKWFPHFGMGYYYVPKTGKGTLLLHFSI